MPGYIRHIQMALRDYLKGEEKKGLHYNLPIEQKESNRWVESYRKTQEIADEFPESTVIN